MKTLEQSEERLKLKSDLNLSVSIFMMLALGALIGTIGFAIILFILNFLSLSTGEISNTLELTTEQETIFLLLAMTAFGALMIAAFMPLNTEYKIERSSMLFTIKTNYFISMFNEIQKIPCQDIRRIETRKLGGQGQIHLVLADRSINISNDVEISEDRAEEITDSMLGFIKNG